MTRSVFISSTTLDLRDHRAAVDAAIRRLEQRPINMDDFGSQPGGPVDVSLTEVGKADVFIGILARRYGYIPAGKDKSVTEQEYDEAIKRGLPRLMYIVDPDHDWDWPGKSDPANQEDADKQAKLAAFKARVEASEVRSRFATPDNLAQQVTADLTKLFKTLQPESQLHSLTVPLLLGLLLIFIIAAAAVVSLLPQSQRDPFLQSVGLIQPTPLEGHVCSDEEVCVVIAQFTGERGGDQQINMLEVLNEAAAEVGDVSVIPIGYPLESRTDAQGVGRNYNATLVIYGRVTAGGVTVSYEVTREQQEVETQVEGEFRTSAAQVENFEVFLYEGMQSRYVLSFTVGQLHLFNDRYSEALRTFNAALTDLSGDQTDLLNVAALQFYRGYSYGRLDDETSAIAAYTEAIRLDSGNAIAYNNRGLALADQGKLDEAIADYTEAIRLDPSNAIAYSNRGVVLYAQDNQDAAIADYNYAIHLNPDYAIAYSNRGLALSAQGKLDEAVADYTQAIRLDTTNATAYFNRGATLYAQGNLDAAIVDYTQAIFLNAHNPIAYTNRGATLYVQGKLNEAIADYTEAIHLDPDFVAAYLNRGSTYYDQQEYPLAIADYLTYERLTGQLEPFMVTRIAEMEAALGTPTAVATP